MVVVNNVIALKPNLTYDEDFINNPYLYIIIIITAISKKIYDPDKVYKNMQVKILSIKQFFVNNIHTLVL